MYSNMKQIAVLNGHGWQILVHLTELWIFHNMLGPGLRNDIAALTL